MFVTMVFLSYFTKNGKNAISPDQSFSFQRILAQKYVDFHYSLKPRWRLVGGNLRSSDTPCPGFAKNHPIGLIMLCTLLIYPSKQYSITCSVKTCPRTYLLSVLWGWKKTSLAILLSPNVTSAELLWVNLGNNGIYFCIYFGKLGESAT